MNWARFVTNKVAMLGTFGLSIFTLGAAQAATIQVNFQPAGSVVPSGYIKDSGLGYLSSRGYGWLRLHYNSPINISSTARERNLTTDQRVDTLLHMQSTQGPAAYWEYNLPRGDYQVTVGVGDPGAIDSIDTIRVEGVTVVNRFVPTSSRHTATGTARVTVTDGRLTVDAYGGSNTKIDYINIVPVGSASHVPPVGNLQAFTADQNVMTDRLMYSTIKEAERPAKVVTLTNGGTGTLRITSLTIENSVEQYNGGRSIDYQRKADFVLVNPPQLPLQLAPGASTQISVKFLPKRVAKKASSPVHLIDGEDFASLNILVENSKFPAKRIALAGIDSPNPEGSNEPAVQELMRIYGWKTNVGSELDSLASPGTSVKTPLGDEILSPYFVRSDVAKAVEIWPIGVYVSRSADTHNAVSFKAKAGSNGVSGTLYTFVGSNDADNVPGSNVFTGGENQKVFPKIFRSNASQYPTQPTVSFYPNSAFALLSRAFYQAWTDDNQNGPGKIHEWRIYPVKDAYGNITPNVYIGAVDFNNTNNDYNDSIFLIKNVRSAP